MHDIAAATAGHADDQIGNGIAIDAGPAGNDDIIKKRPKAADDIAVCANTAREVHPRAAAGLAEDHSDCAIRAGCDCKIVAAVAVLIAGVQDIPAKFTVCVSTGNIKSVAAIQHAGGIKIECRCRVRGQNTRTKDHDHLSDQFAGCVLGQIGADDDITEAVAVYINPGNGTSGIQIG